MTLVAIILTLAILKIIQQPILVTLDSAKIFIGKLPSPAVFVNLVYAFTREKMTEAVRLV